MRVRLLISLLIIYVILAGATFDGILNAQRRLQSVVILAVTIGVWLWGRRRWRWHSTSLDLPILLWCVAFAVSLVTNAEAWRRISIGLWYMGLYIVAWYALQDALANGRLRRQWLVDALLIAGVPVVFVGFAQVQVALMNGQPLPRPVGTLGNANALGALLVLLIPFALGRLLMVRSPLARVVLTLYSVAILVLLALSFSRGGWLGAAVALVVWVMLRFPLRHLWKSQSRTRRIALSILLGVVAAAGLAVMLRTFSIGGRSLDVRTWIYDTALQLFSERPLAGSGLFTFGAGLSRLNSLPPLEPHSHAHNIILQVATELGIIGVIALALTAWRILRAMFRPKDPIVIMGVAAFAGFVAHQMVDVPAMMPALALTALLTLSLFMFSTPDEQSSARRTELKSARWKPLVVMVVSFVLLVSAIWSALNYREYIAALGEGIASGDYRDAAERLQTLAASDPALAVYPQQAGMLFGLAADEGDTTAIEQGIEQLRHYTAIEPSYASGWANLAALYAAAGEITPAADAMQKAVSLAPQSWSLWYRYGVYAEAARNIEAAEQAYRQANAFNDALPLLSEWDQSSLRQSIWNASDTLSAYPQTIFLLESGDLEGARQAWEQGDYENTDYSNVHVIYMLFALADGDSARAQAELQAARRVATERNARVWVYLGAAYLNPANFDTEIAAARRALETTVTAADWELGANISYIQYLTLAIPRQFLPQVGYSEDDLVLLYLLNTPDALANIRATLLS